MVLKEEDQGTDTQAPTDQDAPTPQNEVEPPQAPPQVNNTLPGTCSNMCIEWYLSFHDCVIPKL